MAHSGEPMDIDNIESDFDNKENSIQHSNVYPRTPCTEKGYEELDVSELNMKLRYSITPAASPMSKSYTANCVDNKNFESGDDTLNANLTRSLHAAVSKSDVMNKSVKSLPLQSIPTDQLIDNNRNMSVLRPLDATAVDGNLTVTATQTNDEDENLSVSPTSTLQTPEATTPTKEIPRSDGGSPIMRGLKSVLNMFRSSQSPIPPSDNAEVVSTQVLSPDISVSTPDNSQSGLTVLASTPIVANKHKDGSLSRRSSPHKENLVFNEDLEKELLWKDETTILFSQEKIPIHKLFFQQSSNLKNTMKNEGPNIKDDLNSTLEYMDISYNDSVIKNKTITDLQIEGLNESDGEFVDCETTYTNDNSSVDVPKENEMVNKENESNTNMTQVICPLNAEKNLSASNLEAPLLTESLKSEAVSSDATITLNNEKNCNVLVKSVVESKQVQYEGPEHSYESMEKYKGTAENNTPNFGDIHNEIKDVTASAIQIGQIATVPSEVSQSHPMLSNDLPLNMTLDTCNLLTQMNEIIIKSDTHPGNSTVLLTEPDVVNDHVRVNIGDATFVQKIEFVPSLSDICNTTYNATCNAEHATIDKECVNDPKYSTVNNITTVVQYEDKTFVKETKIAPELYNKNTFICEQVEDVTFVKENVSLPLNDIATTTFSKDLDATFMKKMEGPSNDSNKIFATNVDYNNFVKEIEKSVSEEKINTSTPSTDTDSPANVPLPDEDDNENDKSLGASMLIEEKRIPIGLDINNTTVTELNNENDIEEIPNDTAKSIDNNVIPAEMKEPFATFNIEENLEHTIPSDSNTTLDHEVLLEQHAKLDVYHPTKVILSQEFSMEVNTSIPGEAQSSVDLQNSDMYASMAMNFNQDIDLAQVSNVPGVNEDFKSIFRQTEKVENNTGVLSKLVTDTLNISTIASDASNPQMLSDLKETQDLCNSVNTAAVIEVTNAENQGLKSEILNLKENDICQSDNVVVAALIKAAHASPFEQIQTEIINKINNTTVNECALNQVHTGKITPSHDNVHNISALVEHELDLTTEIVKTVVETPVVNNVVTEMLEANNAVSETPESNNTVSQTVEPDNLVTEMPEATNAVSETPQTNKTDTETLEASNAVPKTPEANNEVTVTPEPNNTVTQSLESNNLFTEIPGGNNAVIEILDTNNAITEKTNVVTETLHSTETILTASLDKINIKNEETDVIEAATKNPVHYEEVQNPFATKSRVVLTPPSSPKIVSKGYNFNFDEIVDPFATKTKISMSPTFEKSTQEVFESAFEEKPDLSKRDINKNRRKSQPERKRPTLPKKKFNSTFSGSVKGTKSDNKICEVTQSNKDIKTASICDVNNDLNLYAPKNIVETVDIEIKDPEIEKSQEPEDLDNKDTHKELNSFDHRDIDTTTNVVANEGNKSVESLNNVLDEKTATSSSEQSTYFSAGNSSVNSTINKNVFNIPEIGDMNFNPFITKSKMRQSPPPGIEEPHKGDTFNAEPNTTTSTDIYTDCVDLENKIYVSDDKEFSNVSNTTCSSKATDEKDVTVREVETEDEDTVEGPFLELDDNDKMSDFDGDDVDMMQFSELPPQNIEENVESGEMFIDAEAFEFLLNQNKTNVVSDSGKESLFLKFDPLFAKRVSTDGVLAALNKVQKRQSTPKKMTAPVKMDDTFDKTVAGPSSFNVTQEIEANVTTEESAEELNVTVSKPMMVVTPAVNPVVTPRNKITTPTSLNRRSITFTSPAIAVIDRLLSLSANNSLVGHDTTVTQVSREQNEADLALTQLRELLAEKEISVYNLRSETKELKDRLLSMESQMRTLESEGEERLKKVNELNEKLSEKTKINKSMAAVVEEYERTIASLIAETEQDKKRHNEERIKLIKERDEQTAHLASMEVSFSDLHSKYEKSKQIILTCKANEDSYKKSIKEFEENLTKMQSNYELLKQHATSKLNHANQELEKMNRAHESEVLKMNAMIKRKELHITSLEETLAQKTKANEELTAICDELINKVG